jgi:hypothetical protein
VPANVERKFENPENGAWLQFFSFMDRALRFVTALRTKIPRSCSTKAKRFDGQQHLYHNPTARLHACTGSQNPIPESNPKIQSGNPIRVARARMS